MEPRIGRSIGQGFRAANKSWVGIALFIGCWIAILAIVGLGIALTRPPVELFQERLPSVGVPPAPGATAPTPPGSQPADLFNQMEAGKEAASSPAPATAAPATPSPQATDARRAVDERSRRIMKWFGQAWPMLGVCFLLLMATNLLLNGGQIGYLHKRVMGQPVSISEFWRAGSRAFVGLLGALLLVVLAIGIAGLTLMLLAGLFSLLGKGLPGVVVSVLSVLIGAAAVVGIVWLAVKVSFWFIAIVVDRVGPLAGFAASVRATRGRWWRTLGLGLLIVLISYAVWIPFALLEWVGNRIGGPLAPAVGVISNLLGGVASIVVGFAILAAYIQFYEDAKSITPVQVAASPSASG
ncbi:MAG: hypothetical protein HYZ91_02390 [Candidatus Omnitrophica bacterium]|nr:hypothetical protein [Candidatus Omnitrophota bacterium]